MQNLQIRKVNSLPTSLVANTIYIVNSSATEAEMFVTNNSGTIVARQVVSPIADETFTVTLPNNTTDFVNIKVFNETDKFNFTVSAQATGNVDAFTYSIFQKSFTNNSVFRRFLIGGSNLEINVDSTTGRTLRIRASGTPAQNQEIKINIKYHWK